jgi:hypothetical protein
LKNEIEQKNFNKRTKAKNQKERRIRIDELKKIIYEKL